MSSYTSASTISQLDPKLYSPLREHGNLYDFMTITAGIQLCENLIPSILDDDERQLARELINEEDVHDSDIPTLVSILETIDGGHEWCEKNIKTLMYNTLNFNIHLDTISTIHYDFISQLTSDPIVMKGVKGGDIWGCEKTKKFIEWCDIELTQSDKVRTNYYYLIREYYIGKINPIGIIGIRQVNKHSNKQKYNKTSQRHNIPLSENTTSINYNLDIFISPEYQNYGSGTCAIRKCLELYWTIHPNRQITINIPSDLNIMIKVATKIGATMEKSFKTGRSTFLKYVISSKTMIYPDNDYIYLPPNERRVIISRRTKQTSKTMK